MIWGTFSPPLSKLIGAEYFFGEISHDLPRHRAKLMIDRFSIECLTLQYFDCQKVKGLAFNFYLYDTLQSHGQGLIALVCR